jgi:FtsP/CotA-like multicopper oxidase with cupredoxin domain
VDNHSITVIEADSTLVKPHTVQRVPIHVAQRYSIILETNQSTSTNYWLRGEMIQACFTGDNDVLDGTTKAVISYSGNNAIIPSDDSADWAEAILSQCQDLAESDLIPVEQKIPPAATKMWRLDFSFGIGDYQLDRAKINGTIWSSLTNTTTLQNAISGLNGKVQGANASAFETDGIVSDLGPSQFVVGLASSEVEVVDVLIYSLDEVS